MDVGYYTKCNIKLYDDDRGRTTAFYLANGGLMRHCSAGRSSRRGQMQQLFLVSMCDFGLLLWAHRTHTYMSSADSKKREGGLSTETQEVKDVREASFYLLAREKKKKKPQDTNASQKLLVLQMGNKQQTGHPAGFKYFLSFFL